MDWPLSPKSGWIDRLRCKNAGVSCMCLEERLYGSAECMSGQTEKTDKARE